MNEFLNKLSLYDFLTTIVLGGCVMFALNLIGDECAIFTIKLNPQSIIGNLYKNMYSSNLFLVGCCYLLGLITHKIAEVIDISFFYKLKNDLPEQSGFWKILRDIVLSPIYRNNPAIIKRSKEYAEKIYLKQLPDTKKDDEKCYKYDLLDKYYTAYYRLADIDKLFNVPKIEAASAFLKDLIFVWIVVLLSSFFVKIKIIDSYLLFVLLGILLFWARYYSEFKIHYLVWEGCVQYLRPCCCKQNSTTQSQPSGQSQSSCPCGKLPNDKHYGRLKCPYCTQDFSENANPCLCCKCEKDDGKENQNQNTLHEQNLESKEEIK